MKIIFVNNFLVTFVKNYTKNKNKKNTGFSVTRIQM